MIWYVDVIIARRVLLYKFSYCWTFWVWCIVQSKQGFVTSMHVQVVWSLVKVKVYIYIWNFYISILNKRNDPLSYIIVRCKKFIWFIDNNVISNAFCNYMILTFFLEKTLNTDRSYYVIMHISEIIQVIKQWYMLNEERSNWGNRELEKKETNN